jgi:hypothetical protein
MIPPPGGLGKTWSRLVCALSKLSGASVCKNPLKIIWRSSTNIRSLAGPPVSHDDLRTLSDAVLSPGRLRNDPAMARRVIEVVPLGLDRRRSRRPHAGLPRSWPRRMQVAFAEKANLKAARRILCSGSGTTESWLSSGKVSNSAINSVKRLNREAAAKGEAWIRDLGAV